VLEAIGASRSVARTIVVSGEPGAQKIAADFGAEVVPDPSDAGTSSGAGGNRSREARGPSASSCCRATARCSTPRARPAADRTPRPLRRDRPRPHGEGTNSLVLRPPGAIVPAFVRESRARHVAAAREAGIPFAVEQIASLELDLDTPADVIALTRELDRRRGRAKRTAKVLGI